jgi:hypothetical protein
MLTKIGSTERTLVGLAHARMFAKADRRGDAAAASDKKGLWMTGKSRVRTNEGLRKETYRYPPRSGALGMGVC